MSALAQPGLYPPSPFQLKGHTSEVRGRTDGAAAAGLAVSDCVVSIEGRPLRGYADLAFGLQTS